ncbi:mitochondrial 2-oxodicarboxylate carrier isoform X2 [Carcharodon carcharias]|uniref:mitochondrial 2-oxodicarboxylate carrier isoform X2 n=1 Tax=Carcharodon carcharias TaxID=13397 RepID=UPI001B7DBC40|nr:mitochondrial 2-oxodicarboxylate carrier isoform X2 [Carcharodon carcharias]XP_041070296.1 mitochondrial 2-oxodicarboxylate carrier isoform X2 [Carcharodon carcharias]XP_041070298.1 mitochondrial 2-oxodicarboxylate carrier isoform X2 [Carcharodon carcharias]XP_041070299.1 mitochondrial 2-oxodicarboxylate carrier isoform X2 [Carcharodon carcharias]XP_041070300.1 mitochondrial 2-oxodicarboxylate carrier isoform X2 [Carcharodon carcharias]XP_041070301.1 mitochondrial 2-oxodicarboxylate carrier
MSPLTSAFCSMTGLVEICLMHPLDVVKTRFQIQRGKGDATSYKSLGHCFKTIFHQEGILGFYKGILPPILAETPKRAVKFLTFEQYKKILSYASLPSGVIFPVAGLGSGLTEAVVVNPFEVVKVSLQAQRNSFSEPVLPDLRTQARRDPGTAAHPQGSALKCTSIKLKDNMALFTAVAAISQQPSTFAYASEIIRTQGFGLQGLNKGLTATLGRHGVFNMIYFGFYFNVKNMIPVNEDPAMEFLRKLGIGLLSGTIASCVNIPFDVAKSRIQGPQPKPGVIKYRTCFSTIKTIYREEGFFALYKGLVPKIMRLGPGGAVMLLVYEYSFAWLQENF